MKTLIYVGNKVSNHGLNVSTIDTLGALLQGEGFKVVMASSKKNILLRFLHMLWVVFVHRKQTDFVLIDTYSTLSFWYAFYVSKLCKYLRLPYIPILHGGNLPYRFSTSRKATSFLVNHAFKTVIPSEYLHSHLKEFDIPRVQIIPNAVELDNYTFKMRDSFRPKLLWVRALAKIYNPEMAVQVVAILKKEYPEAQLTMIGPFKDISKLEMQTIIDSYGLEVQLPGKLSKEEWIARAKDYDIFINTTTIDNMPVSVMEAMALGLPVVSTNVGGIPFLIEHGKTGQLVESNNPQAMVAAIKIYLNDFNYANQMAVNANNHIQNFDWRVVKHQWIQLFESN
jgi:glycosyltransferase involved in cell wall biosynthesis